MSTTTPNLNTLDIKFARMEDDEMDELFEKAVYDAAVALEAEPEYYDDEPAEATSDLVEYVPSFDPEYDHEGDTPAADPEQCRGRCFWYPSGGALPLAPTASMTGQAPCTVTTRAHYTLGCTTPPTTPATTG